MCSVTGRVRADAGLLLPARRLALSGCRSAVVLPVVTTRLLDDIFRLPLFHILTFICVFQRIFGEMVVQGNAINSCWSHNRKYEKHNKGYGQNRCRLGNFTSIFVKYWNRCSKINIGMSSPGYATIFVFIKQKDWTLAVAIISPWQCQQISWVLHFNRTFTLAVIVKLMATSQFRVKNVSSPEHKLIGCCQKNEDLIISCSSATTQASYRLLKWHIIWCLFHFVKP